MDGERDRLRSLLPLVVGVGGLGLAVALIVDGVQKNASCRQVDKDVTPNEDKEVEENANALAAGKTTPLSTATPAANPPASPEEENQSATSSETSSATSSATSSVALPEPKMSASDKRAIYKRAYEKARRRAPVDPRANAIARQMSA